MPLRFSRGFLHCSPLMTLSLRWTNAFLNSRRALLRALARQWTPTPRLSNLCRSRVRKCVTCQEVRLSRVVVGDQNAGDNPNLPPHSVRSRLTLSSLPPRPGTHLLRRQPFISGRPGDGCLANTSGFVDDASAVSIAQSSLISGGGGVE